MSELSKLLGKYDRRDAAIEGRSREATREVFLAWKDGYAARLCSYMRLYANMRQFSMVTPFQVAFPAPLKSADWCNAAVLILTVASEDVQDRFLRSSAEAKDAIVQAVIDDDGLFDLNGHWHEVPPL